MQSKPDNENTQNGQRDKNPVHLFILGLYLGVWRLGWNTVWILFVGSSGFNDISSSSSSLKSEIVPHHVKSMHPHYYSYCILSTFFSVN